MISDVGIIMCAFNDQIGAVLELAIFGLLQLLVFCIFEQIWEVLFQNDS